MSILGGLHVTAAVLALAAAFAVLIRPKGTTAHVRLGRWYVVLLVLVDLSALLTYRPTSGPGPFHPLAVASLATLAAAILWSPRRRGSAQTHAILMIWSVAGLIGAGLAQGATAALPDAAHWPTLVTTTGIWVLAALATRTIASPRPRVRQLPSAVGPPGLGAGLHHNATDRAEANKHDAGR